MVVVQEMGFNLGAEALSRIYHERGNDFERALDAVLAMQMTPQPQPVVSQGAHLGLPGLGRQCVLRLHVEAQQRGADAAAGRVPGVSAGRRGAGLR